MDIWHQRIDEEFGTKGAFVMKVEIFDDVNCSLGEGPLWHPERGELFWFDINTCMLYAKSDGARREWRFDGHVTAAGWIDRDHLMVAHERALLHFNIETGAHDVICALEADNPITRSNDGRADPWGAFGLGRWAKGWNPMQARSIAIIVANCARFTPRGLSPTHNVLRPTDHVPI